MSWSIPSVPEKEWPEPLNRTAWFGALIAIHTIVFAALYYLAQNQKPVQLIFYGVGISFGAWLPLFSFFLIQYESKINDKINWDIETERTDHEWHVWAKNHIPILANVIYTPEENPSDVFFRETKDVPVFPKIPRPLHLQYSSWSDVFEALNRDLMAQCSNYRYSLSSIIIITKNESMDIEQAVFDTWQLVPEFHENLSAVNEFYDSAQQGLTLIIALQLWLDAENIEFSEFMSSQLICTQDYSKKNKLPVQARIERMMPLDNADLNEELSMWHKYSKAKEVKQVWLPYDDASLRADIIQLANLGAWGISDDFPVVSIEQIYGPSSDLSFLISVGIVIDRVFQAGHHQLIVSQFSDNGCVCFITPEVKYG
ncbi:MAG: hypothetical protein ACK5NC_06400 [Vibrio sp.]